MTHGPPAALTDVVSECVKPRPHPAVVEWRSKAEEDEVTLSVVTFAQMRDGTEQLPAGVRRGRLEHWLRTEGPARCDG